MTNTISIPVDAELYAEFLFRTMDKKKDINGWINNIIADYLERTADEDWWAEEYYDWRKRQQPEKEFKKKYGDPDKGYQWQTIFLPNGTQISMTYKGTKEYAYVGHGEIHYKAETYSPATLARKIANNTSRNAWRDLYIKRPNDNTWYLADNIRHGKVLTLEDI